MKKKLTIVIIPDGVNATRQMTVPQSLAKVALVAGLFVAGISGFFLLDYMQLRSLRHTFQNVSAENEGLKGEARVLMQNLEEVKRSLRRVQDYTSKLSDLTTVKVQRVSKQTGIGPLTKEEFKTASMPGTPTPSTDYVPIGINMDNLTFRPVFDRLASLGQEANGHAFDLQHLLSTLSQQKSLLSSIPSISPVDGWITSGYGHRISPFTGQRTSHMGIDIAAPTGTPILAPADGVVIFTGAKDGFGNFIMIAHGYGVVSRYGHNHQNMVQPGQRVSRGEQIGTVGMSGRTTGPHLHYEIVVNGNTENPERFILDMDEFKTAH